MQGRCRALRLNRVALWDVLARCDRVGSLDSNIVKQSVQANRFSDFLRDHIHVRARLFNGGPAQ